jgi:membrane protease YdiL (CAAX protease family)
VCLVFALATAACATLYAARNVHPLLANNLHAVVAVVFWLLPLRAIDRIGRDSADYGLRWRPVLRHLAWAGLAVLIVFPPFALGYRGYHQVVCHFMRSGACVFFRPDAWRAHIRWPPNLPMQAAAQLIVIAIPEEFFFRGYLQGRLRDVFRPVPAIAISSVLFGLGHYLVDFDPGRLAVAFPAVVFGWLRERTGSIVPGAVFHAASNLFIETLNRTFFG